MNIQKWNEAMNLLDLDIVEKYVEDRDRLIRRSRVRSVWLRSGALAACFLMLLSALTVLPLLKKMGDDPVIDPSDDTVPPIKVPSVSTTVSGDIIAGTHSVTYGEYKSYGPQTTACYAPLGFYLNTVVQANVIEVLPDRYREPLFSTTYYIVRLAVVDAIRGEGHPDEIYMMFSEYPRDVFEGYDTFIFSLEQTGIENYMLINKDKGEVEYFPHMFEVSVISDLGYGSVLAFNGGRFDVSFWDKVTRRDSWETWRNEMLDDPALRYPARRDSTLDEVKENIKEIIRLNDYSGRLAVYPSSRMCDYVTAEDVFFSDEAKHIREYLEPSEKSFFRQSFSTYGTTGTKNTVSVTYTRIINGFRTDDEITIKGYRDENGTVTGAVEPYTDAELSCLPDIREALSRMNLSDMSPPHIEISDEMKLEYVSAGGFYRKIDGKVYGIVCVFWYYGLDRTHVRDDCYIMYDVSGNGYMIERAALNELLGDDNYITADFEYKYLKKGYVTEDD